MRTITALLTALCLALMCAPSTAFADGGKASRYLQGKHKKLVTLMRAQKGSGAIDNQEVSKVIADLLDFEELSRRALKDHWGTRSKADRNEFVSLLQQLVERNYRDNLQRTLDYQIRYDTEESQGESVLVTTVARSKKNRRAPEVVIAYSMRQVEGQWSAYDITTDDVSLVQNYQRQFNKIIKKDGWSGLLKRMREKLAKSPS